MSQRDIFKVISVCSPSEFEDHLNDAGADGFKVVPLTVVIRPASYECVMGKTVSAEQIEQTEVRERAARSGIQVPESYGV